MKLRAEGRNAQVPVLSMEYYVRRDDQVHGALMLFQAAGSSGPKAVARGLEVGG